MKVFLVLLIVICFNSVSAQVSLYEQEPNNTPHNGNQFKAPMVVLGNMQDNDQDMFIWNVSDADANYFWNIELDGLPEKLTKVDFLRMEFTEDGSNVTKVHKLFSISSHDGIATIQKSRLIFSPGLYYIGLSYAGGSSHSGSRLYDDSLIKSLGDEYLAENKKLDAIKVTEQIGYKLNIIKGKKIYTLKANNDKDNPTQLRNNSVRGIYFDENTKWLKINVSEIESEKVWKFNGNVVIGETIAINFYDSNSELKTKAKSDKFGYFSLPDLNLTPGEYLLEVISKKNAITSVEFKSVGAYISGQESEPNDFLNDSNTFEIGKTVTGQIGKTNEHDHFSFEVSDEMSQNHIQIRLSNSENKKLELCLFTSQNVQLQCRSHKGDFELSHITLAAGSYLIRVSRGEINTQYSFNILDKGKRSAIQEAEPNDTYRFATAMNAKRIIKGNLTGKESDFFKFEVTEKAQMWTIQAIGDNITNLTLYNSAGKIAQEQRFPKGTKRARLSNLYLMPGKHAVRLYGEESKYLLRVFPIGPVDKSFETEPNDSSKLAMPLPFNQVKKGVLQNKSDKDFYRIHLNNEQGINLIIQPPAGGSIKYNLQWEGVRIGRKTSKKGAKLEYTGVLSAGDYILQIAPGESPSGDLYTVELTHYDSSQCSVDCEPNDTAYQANKIIAPMKLIGKTGSHEDYDWYKLPAFANQTLVTFQNNRIKDDYTYRAFIKHNKAIKVVIDKEKKQTSFLVPANEESYYRLSNRENDYDVSVLIDSKESEAPIIYQDLKIKIHDLPSQVKAYSSLAQYFSVNLEIENFGDTAQPFTIHSHSNNYKWQIIFDENIYEVQAKQKITLPVQIKVPAEAARRDKVRIGFFAKNEESFLAKIWQDVEVKADAPLKNTSIYWSIHDKLLGGINVAATSMGGQRTKEDLAFNVNAVGTDFNKLFDGFTAQGLGMQYRGGRKPQQDYITIELAGDKLIDVQGIILDPLSKVMPSLYLKDFDFHLSTDGIKFKSVLKGQVKSVSAEQSFVLPQVVPAKFARLYLLNSHENRPRSNTALGEWKVITQPTQNITGDVGFNIADPKLGGHVSWAIPQSSGKWDINILSEEKEKAYARALSDNDWQWVVGFHHQRTAKISKIQWIHSSIDVSKKSNYNSITHIKVLASVNSNVGPWKVITEKEFQKSSGMEEIILQTPVWARYLKFSVSGIKNRNYAYFPETIRIIEQAVDANYQSILGEWGELSENAIYEKLNPPKITNKNDDKNNNSKALAIDLSQAKTASGQVQLEFADKPDWYKYIPATGENTLNISLSGKQTVETVIHVEDQNRNIIPLIQVNNETNKAKFQIQVDAGNEYFIKVEEPPRSVIFAWDTSGSTQAYESMIYEAISSYSNDVIPGRDTVNFLPFGGQLLMDKWYGKPFYLKTILNNYGRKDDSSSAEKTLYIASKALEKRQGSKAIIIITDAITGKFVKMWESLEKTRPRIFSIGIIGNGFGGNPNRQIDLMQSWSRVNNGTFQKVVTSAEVEQAFDQAATKLRQPADYTLNVTSEYIKAPGPGTLAITQDDNSQSIAVELILDASGSMLKRLDGKRRINIAKEVLIKTVTEIIPAKTLLALRVFGDKQANACRTDLAIKLMPLEPNSAKKVIKKIYAKNLAKTPIAGSLAKVATDLKAHKGKKIVILVTDGEETCDGNPEQVIEKLIEDGIDIRLNIVGFAIDDDALKAQFNQWSTQGGGKYFDSNNPESLKESVIQALKTPYSVFSQSGELIQEGTVNGKPLELPAGYYTIKIYGSEIKTYEKYRIKGEVLQRIEL